MLGIFMMKLYLHPRCSTCKKAQQYLTGLSIPFECVDLTIQAPSKEELTLAIECLGSIRKVFNTSGLRYRELQLKDKLEHLSEDEALDLLVSDGMLVKRPFLLHPRGVIVGFRQLVWQDLLLSLRDEG